MLLSTALSACREAYRLQRAIALPQGIISFGKSFPLALKLFPTTKVLVWFSLHYTRSSGAVLDPPKPQQRNLSQKTKKPKTLVVQGLSAKEKALWFRIKTIVLFRFEPGQGRVQPANHHKIGVVGCHLVHTLKPITHLLLHITGGGVVDVFFCQL